MNPNVKFVVQIVKMYRRTQERGPLVYSTGVELQASRAGLLQVLNVSLIQSKKPCLGVQAVLKNKDKY